jgi:mRNA interferase HigB
MSGRRGQAVSDHEANATLGRSRLMRHSRGQDFRSICAVDYRTDTIMIRFFGSHAEYDRINAETV